MKRKILTATVVAIAIGVFVLSVYFINVCVSTLNRGNYIYESFWTKSGLVSTIILCSALLAICIGFFVVGSIKLFRKNKT